jgi:hypothetical protein
MPDLSKFGVPQYQAGQPYHYEFDNLPLATLARRDEVINDAVDLLITILEGTAGTQGSLANRLNQSLDEDGNLIPAAVDESMHNIGAHTDGSVTVDTSELNAYISLGYLVTNPVDFVRMLSAERAKLAQIQENASKLEIQVETQSQTYTYGDQSNDVMALVESDTIEWTWTAPNQIKANVKASNPHSHFYEQVPTTNDYQNYTVPNATPFKEGSLRVYINGVRLNSMSSVKVPNLAVTSYTLNRFTENHANGTFALLNAVTSTDVVIIDFDIVLS